jgi:glycosyltransferase involved in cell wall biosynthesis
MRKLEILCVCEPLTFGVPMYVEQVVRRLEGDTFHFTLACPRSSTLRSRLTDTSVEFVNVEMQAGLNPAREFEAALQLWRGLRGKPFDVVHFHSSKAGLLGRPLTAVLNLPSVFTPHCFSFESVRGSKLKFGTYCLVEKILGRLTDRLVCVAETERDLALRLKITAPERVILAPCFADAKRWGPRPPSAALKAELGIPQDHYIVGTVSRFYPQKAPLDFARLAERITRQREDVTFLFVGANGPLRQEFEQFLRERDLARRVILCPWVDDITEAVALMDIVVLNSLWEGLPLSLIEAMAMGKPILATDISGNRELVGGAGCGLLSPAGQPELMAVDLLRLLRSRNLMRTLGGKGRQTAQAKYSLEASARIHEEIYLSLAGRTGTIQHQCRVVAAS